jgi:hypothetical protein
MASISATHPHPLTPSQSTLRIWELDKKLKALASEMRSLRKANSISTRWWHDAAGRFENDPVFDEIVRLGRETRNPRTQRSRGKRARS